MKQLTMTARDYVSLRQGGQKRKPYVRRSPAAERTYGSIVFDSKAELERYQQLLTLKLAGAVRRIVLQPGFDLGGVLYRPDFEVFLHSGAVVYEEVKPPRAPEDVLRRFRRNQQQLLTLHGVEVKLVEMTA